MTDYVLNYDAISLASNTMKVLVYITGFTINQFQTGTKQVFGLGIRNIAIGPSSAIVSVYVYGRA